ncbi:DUF1254 domain-containing protein [Chlorogloeopsis fritschii PCC 9212]|nr:DUF1254 domain-containing protein [Chlorogloeopsis fritschii]
MSTQPKIPITPDEARAIAKEAYIYGFPIVDNMRIQYGYFVDQGNPEYKGPYNQIFNIPRVYTPEDKVVQTPNSDTPYSWIGLDLRAEPIVFTVPPIEKERYWSLQLIDLYTHNFDYLGSRTTGNDGGNFAVAGPNWQGETPARIKKVIRCETQIAMGLFRTQLYNPSDLENVKQIQQRYRVQPLSAFLGQPAPDPAPSVDFPKPLTPEAQRTSIEFFDLLNFYLQFCPTHPSEVELMERFTKINIGARKDFAATLSPEMKKAVEDGIADAWKEFNENKKANVDTGKLTAADGFGTREFLHNNYLFRMTSAALGIYGNSKEEALYPAYYTDSEGQKLNGANRYIVRFEPGQLPPANAFWSITMYELPASLLVANPIDRYLINSPMLPHLKRDDDQGITLYVQNESPGQDKESNWLPAPTGPFWVTVRLYWPKEEALNGTWKLPPMQRVKEE